MEPYRAQHDCLAAYAVAQQYSSAIFIADFMSAKKNSACNILFLY